VKLVLVSLAFGVGCLATAGRPSGRGLGWVLAILGGVVAVLSAVWRPRRSERSTGLLTEAALLGPPTGPLGPCQRVLEAAGLPGRPSAPGRQRPAAWTLPVVIAAFVAGAGWALVRAPPSLGPLDGRHVRFLGTAVSDLGRQDWGWSVEVRLDRAAVDGQVVEATPKVLVSGSEPVPTIAAGQPVSGEGVLDGLPRPARDFEAYLVGRGVTARLDASRLSVRGPPANPALRLANAVRDAFRTGAGRSLPDRQAGLLRGLAIGDTAGMDREIEEDFRASGLAHLLAVSGSNVALVLAPALAVAARLRLRPGRRALVASVVVTFFALVTRWEPSVLRATAMAAIALVALWAGRPRRVGPALAVAVLSLLVLDPLLSTSVGFQLSVAATAGLAAMAGPLATRLSWLPRPVAGAAAATLAAQIAVTPLLLLRFGVVPSVTLVANVLAFPAVAPALLLGTMASGLANAWPDGGRMVGRLAGAPLGYLVDLSDWMAQAPLPSLTGGAVAALLATAVAALVAWALRRRVPGLALIVAAVVAALGWASVPSTGPPSSLTVTFLDVGQGDAAVIRTPDGATVLVDAGPDEQQVATELAALGIRRIDLAVATHAHADHIDGFPAILARFPVTLLLDPGCPGDSPSYRRFLDAVRDEGVPVRHPRGGRRLTVGRLIVDVLGPDRCSPGGESPNDDSLVLRMAFGRSTVLFSGDAEVPAQRDLLADEDPVRATVLKVPHHGGDTSDKEFFDAVDSTLAVVSTGPNDYGHPNPGVLESLRAEGMVVHRTDLAGDVTITFAADGSPVVASSG
jgi:competence protein ComEC